MEHVKTEIILQTGTNRYEYRTSKVRTTLRSTVIEWYSIDGCWMLDLFGHWRVILADRPSNRVTIKAVTLQHEANRDEALAAAQVRQTVLLDLEIKGRYDYPATPVQP